jgi:hypothetical protein
MTRARVALVPKAQRTKPPLSLVKKALRLFKGRGVPREVYRRNALAWLRSMQLLGDRHTLKGQVRKGGELDGQPVSWGVPGEPVTHGVHAPRRLGGGT